MMTKVCFHHNSRRLKVLKTSEKGGWLRENWLGSKKLALKNPSTYIYFEMEIA
jgi:hypothetical protein